MTIIHYLLSFVGAIIAWFVVSFVGHIIFMFVFAWVPMEKRMKIADFPTSLLATFIFILSGWWIYHLISGNRSDVFLLAAVCISAFFGKFFSYGKIGTVTGIILAWMLMH